MHSAQTHINKAIRLPGLAVATLLFLGLSTNTHLDAATAWPSSAVAPQPQQNVSGAKKSPVPVVENDPALHALSTRDAGLYRDAFAAQEKADWQAADAALGQIKDKRLVGHVLADRYLRRPMDVTEAKQWMATYADMPEADAIYEQAGHLKGFAAAHITRPTVAVMWASNANGPGASSGFHSQLEIDARTGAVGAKINAALRHGDPLKAREILTTEMQRGKVSVSDQNDIVSHIAATFFYEGEIERARPMAHSAAAAGIPLGLWIDGLSAWKQQDFQSATRSFASLAQAPGLATWDRAAASYWAYRSAKHVGDEVQARHWLAEAAKCPRSFYGMMAVSLSGKHAGPSWKMPELSARNADLLGQNPAGWQALALMQVGHRDLAENELRRVNPMGNREMQNAALALAEKARMPSLTLQLAGVATNDNGQPYEAALYPLPPWQPASGFKVDRALIYALMRHESQFDPDAVSDRGACGLMQIMPSTARTMSNDNAKGRASRDCPDGLFDPAANMEMGQKYVRVLAGTPMIGDNLLLLLAAYNGGPGNLSHWLDSDGRADPLLFVETLPVRETREYVQQVLMQYWMYRARMAEPETAIAQLARGEWPRYALRDEGVRHADASVVKVASSGR